MEKLVIVAVLVNLITFASGKDFQNPSTNIDFDEALERFTDSLLHVTANFLKYYSNSNFETWAVSPISSMRNIAAVALFAKGVTKNETFNVLNVTTREEIVYIFNTLNGELSNLPDCINYKRATDYFGNIDIPFTSEFQGNMSEIIGGLAENVNFFNPTQSTAEINEIVASQTGNRFPNFIDDSSFFNESSQIILVTGIFIMGSWEIEFQRTNEVNQFRVSPSQSGSQTFMYQDGTYKYGHSARLGAEVVEINFCCQTFHIWIVLPDCPFQQNDVIDKMIENNEWYYELRDTMNRTRLDVYVPKYKMTTVTVDSQESFVQFWHNGDKIGVLYHHYATRCESIAKKKPKDFQSDRSHTLCVQRLLATSISTTGVGTIYNEETIDLEGVIENNKKAAISTCIEKVQHYALFEGEQSPDRSQSNGPKRIFKADYPHIFIIFNRNERVYLTGVFRSPVN